MARAAELLAGRYHVVITNVPYLARGKQDERLRDFCERRYDAAKKDLATVFLERCLDFCTDGGTASFVLPQNWLFLASYKQLRTKLLKTQRWHLLARLGEGGFESTAAAGAFAVLLGLSRDTPARLTRHRGEAAAMYGMDASELDTVGGKSSHLRRAEITGITQAHQLNNPDARVTLIEPSTITLLSNYANGVHGFGSKDSPAFFRQFWEIVDFLGDWHFLQTTVNDTRLWSGCEQAVYWQRGEGVLAERGRWGLAVPAGGMAWGRAGVAVSQMRTIPCALYTGEIFDKNVATISPREIDHVPAIWCYCSSPEYYDAVRRIDQTIKVTNATLVKVPFDLDHWTRVAEERYPHGLPLPYTDDPTQWIFHGHPCGSVIWDEDTKRIAHGPLREDAGVLHVAVARLLGYRWPAEWDEAMELASEQREWVGRCAALHDFADADGIVCLPAVRGEMAAEQRLLRLLSAAYGAAWSDATLPRLLASAGGRSLHDWLRDRFFAQHCKLFHHRPFVWHVWDGRRDGFHALVNYHKLAAGGGDGRRLLESLTYSYLGDWITRQKDGVERGVPGAEDRLASALRLQQRLAAITVGEPPFDIFVRWKPLAEQPIGWNPDVNDGVRLNVRPFMAEDLPGGKAGAGILRAKPNVHWRKDRGKEPRTLPARRKAPSRRQDQPDLHDDRELRPQDDYPWFWASGQFAGDRVNDVHLRNAAKSRARAPADFGA